MTTNILSLIKKINDYEIKISSLLEKINKVKDDKHEASEGYLLEHPPIPLKSFRDYHENGQREKELDEFNKNAVLENNKILSFLKDYDEKLEYLQIQLEDVRKQISIDTNLLISECNKYFLNADAKKEVLRELLIVSSLKDYAIEILARLRDILKYKKNDINYVKFLFDILSIKELDSHEKIYTAVTFYNEGLIDECYKLFANLSYDETIKIEHRIDAIKFLFSTGDDEEIELAQECLMNIITNKNFKSDFRYKVITDFSSRKGISSNMNKMKLKIPYNEDFVYTLQLPFFEDKENDVRSRILSGQSIIQICDSKKDESLKENVIAELLRIADDESNDENTRADAADVILRLGNNAQNKLAREIITKLGTSSKVLGPRSIYENSQNVHDIDDRVLIVIGGLVNTQANLKTFDEIHDEIADYIRSLKLEPTNKYSCFKSLSRISIDTATFTNHVITTAELLVRVWTRANSTELSEEDKELTRKRVVYELSDMTDTCSTGHVNRLVYALSLIEPELKFKWKDQIEGNVKGRVMAKIRDHPDKELTGRVTMGMMKNCEEEDFNAYLSFIKTLLFEIKKEIKSEFTDHISEEEFDKYFNEISDKWLNI